MVVAWVALVVVRPGDQLVLCTDGVHRFVGSEELGDALLEAETCADAVTRVLATAKARGTVDNGTLVVCRDLLRSASVVMTRAPRLGVRTIVAVGLLVFALLSFGSYALRSNAFEHFPNVSTTDRP